jgi:hypothetical protein
MHDVSGVDRAELDADRKRLASLPADAACGLPVGRVRKYLEALAVVVPALSEPTRSRATPASWEALDRKSGVVAGIELPSSALAPAVPLAPAQRSRPWTFRRLARLPSRGTIALVVIGAAVVVTASALGHDLPQMVAEAVIFALVGARAMRITVDRQIRKRGSDEELDEDICDEPGAVVSFCLISGTCAAATIAIYEGARLAGIEVSVVGALVVGLLVTLSLALEYGVVSADRLSLMK